MSTEQKPTWRVRDASGKVHVAPIPIQKGPRTWMCEMEIGGDPLAAVLEWIYQGRIRAVEIAEPGQLFAHEQVAAERERCAGWAAHVARRCSDSSAQAESVQTVWRLECAEHWASRIEARIRSGEEPPLK